MKIKQQFQQGLLHVPPLMWQKFRQAMLNARQDREEVIGFLFCQRHQLSKTKLKYIPVSWVVPTPDCYEHQSEGGLVLKQSFHQYILDTYLSDKENNSSQKYKLDIVHVHTHFGNATPSFSFIDDRHEAEYAKFLASCYRNKPRLISGVFNESLKKSEFRIWDREGINCTPIEFHNGWITPINEVATADTDVMAEIFTRQKVFGDVVQQQLGQLKVALIGCGGIGAVFAEQLARLGVKHWLLVDPDRLEAVNLNRMPAATQKMVDQWWHKVDYVKWLVKRVYAIGSHVRALPICIEDKLAKEEIAAADLIVVATDNHKSRQVAQELALESSLPLVCLGTHIEVKPDNQPRMYCRITIPPLGGGWCLMCGNIINLQQAALESAPTEIIDITQQAGYIEGIDDPAVYWLNSICASTAAGIIHGILAGFLNVDAGLDWIYDFPNSNWLKTNTEHLHTDDCYFCFSDKEILDNNSKQVFDGLEDYWF